MMKQIIMALAASTALVASNAQAAFDTFLKVRGINGTSSVRGFEEYIDIYSFSLGFTRGVCSSLNVMKKMDTSSAEITGATLLGTTFPQAILVLRKPGENPWTFMKMTLNTINFTSIQESGSSGGDDQPTESVSLQPASVKIEAFEQDAVGNAVLVATNTVTCQKSK